MAGNYDRCYARKRKSDGNYWTCYKKKGHHLLPGDKGKHCDNKQPSPHYWEWTASCQHPDCTELVDPYTTQYEPDAIAYCDLHYTEYLDGKYATD